MSHFRPQDASANGCRMQEGSERVAGTSLKHVLLAAAVLVCAACAVQAPVQAPARPAAVSAVIPDVGYAGVSYAGDYQSIRARFPLTSQLIPPHGADDPGGPSVTEQQLRAELRSLRPAHLHLDLDSLGSLKNDRAILVTLLVTNEIASTERIGEYVKLFINLRAQALIFDHKSMTILRTYPISVAYVGATRTMPTAAEQLDKVRLLVSGAGQGSLLGRFQARVRNASVPEVAPRFIGVGGVTITPEAAATMPQYLQGESAQTWLADEFGAALMEGTGVAVLPYTQGYAVGNVLPARMADGTAYNFKIPRPDYPVTIALKAFKKVELPPVPAGRSVIYGAFAHLTLEEPLLGRRYLDIELRNAEDKIVPKSQLYEDDWPAFQDATVGLFRKLAQTLGGTDRKWIKTAPIPPKGAMKQIKDTAKVVNLCR